MIRLVALSVALLGACAKRDPECAPKDEPAVWVDRRELQPPDKSMRERVSPDGSWWVRGGVDMALENGRWVAVARPDRWIKKGALSAEQRARLASAVARGTPTTTGDAAARTGVWWTVCADGRAQRLDGSADAVTEVFSALRTNVGRR